MRIGSLFSGIGGLELGLERAGFGPVAWQVEIDPWCRRVLAKHWPEADRSVVDVAAVRAGVLGRVDLLCGGFPCQDVSVAGDGAGLAGARSGLWFEFARVVGELRPACVVVENVAHGRGRWLPTVRAGLEELGYRVRAVQVSAAECGAPHLRRRVFVVAHTDGQPLRVGAERVPSGRAGSVRRAGQDVAVDAGGTWTAAGPSDWPARPEVRGVDDGVPGWVDRNKGLGNAVVPACAHVAGLVLREWIATNT